MKKQISLLLAAMLLLGQATWAYDFSAVAPSGQTLYYNIVDSTAQLIPGNNAYSYRSSTTGDLSIPDSVTNPNSSITYAVTGIGDNAFAFCSGLASVSIPNSVTTIGDGAFYQCTGLTSVTIPDSVTTIGDAAFDLCLHLTSVTIGSSVTTIGNQAFGNCSGLTSVAFNADNCSNAGGTCNNRAFYGCSNITAFTFGDNVTIIPAYLCYGLSNLTSVTIPTTVTSIGTAAFYGCSSLTSVTIPNLVTAIGDYTFYNCYGLTSITIPNSVTSIGNSVFYQCTGLTSVIFGSSVTSIGDEAFFYCSRLVNLVSRATYPPSCGSGVFNNVPANCILTIPCGSQSYYSVTSPWNTAFHIMNEDCRDEYTITVISDNPIMGSASVDGAETATVLDGDAVTIIATSNLGYRFVRWNDDNTDSVRTVAVTADITYTAYFESTTQDISIADGSDITLYTADGRIVICGVEGMEMRVFDMMGREVVDLTCSGKTAALPRGVYLVKVGALPARKVVVIK